MSVDQIISDLDNYQPFSLHEDTVKAIKAALKAGQVMRSDLQEFVGTEPATLSGFQSCDEWDAATGEDV